MTAALKVKDWYLRYKCKCVWKDSLRAVRVAAGTKCASVRSMSRSVNHTVMLCCYVWGSHGAGVREYTALLWPFHQSEWRNHRHCELTRLEARSTSVCCELVCVQRLVNTHDIYEITVVIADLQPITRLTTVSSHFRNIIGLYLAPWFLIHKV